MNAMRRFLFIVGLLVLLASSALAQSAVDARAAALVDEMMKAMGGPEAWERARYLRFDWVVERKSQRVAYVRRLWDRSQGRYRVEGTTREGVKLVAVPEVP